jgi:hypothetical protein
MSVIIPYPWVFTQLGKATLPPLKLEGPNAPFGRPRKGAVVEKEIEIRVSETFYVGNDEPDRHVFGKKYTPIVLTGRFMDSRIGVEQGAQAKADEVLAFVDARQACRMEWGGMFAATGLLTKCKIGYESAEELIWTLTAALSTDDTQPIRAPIPPPVNTSDLVAQINQKFGNVTQRIAACPPDMKYVPGFMDRVAALISRINTASAAFSNFAASVDNFESTLSSDVAHFRAGIASYKTSVDQLQITFSTAENDSAVQAARAEAQAIYFAIRAQNDLDLLEILAALSTADLSAEIIQQGQPDRTYNAVWGDTWESIADTELGSAGFADQLRQANGVRYGGQPFPGQQIHIPKSAGTAP